MLIVVCTLLPLICAILIGITVWFREAVKRKVILDAMLDHESYILLHGSRDRYVEIAERMTDQRNDADSENARLQGLLYEATKEQPKTAQEFLDSNTQLNEFERGFLEFIAAQEVEDATGADLDKSAKLPERNGEMLDKKLAGIAAFHKFCDRYGSSL